MKRAIALILTLALLLGASCALAAGNVTIARQGKDGFDDYIESMLVFGDRLLLSSYDKLYTWSQEGGLVEIEGYDELRQNDFDTENERTLDLGEAQIELGEGERFYFNGAVYAVDDRLFRSAQIADDDGVVAVLMVEMIVGEDGSLSLGDVYDLGDELTEDYGDGYAGYSDLSRPCSMDGIVYGLVWGDNGQEIAAVDIENEDVDRLTVDWDLSSGSIGSIAPFGDGQLLLIVDDYNGDKPVTDLLVFDPESEETEKLGEMPTIDWETPTALCYDPERGMIYYTLAGSVWRMPLTEEGLGEAEEFADMPVQISNAALLGDLYVTSGFDGVIGRDVTVEKAPEQRLVIEGGSSEMDGAYFSFTEKHPEFMVALRHSGIEEDDVLQAMMGQQSDVDIYCVSSSEQLYSRLLSRGYMAELGGSEKLTAAVDETYPFLQELCFKDGELYAVPLGFYSSAQKISNKLLTEKLGYAQEELPTSWEQVFRVIADLSHGKLEEAPELQILGPGYTRQSVQSSVLYSALSDYFLWLDADEAHVSRASEVLVRLLDAYNEIDWYGLGLPEEYEEDEMWEWNEENILLNYYSLYVDSGWGGVEDEFTPLSIVDGEEPMISADVRLAFVNPFSKHREEAIEYLEMAMDEIEESNLIQMCPNRNDPIESPYYESNLKEIEGTLKDLEEAVAKAEADEDDEALEAAKESLSSYQENYEEFKKYGRWEVSPESIARYREMVPYLVPARSSLWSSEDTYSQVDQFIDGAISAEQLASKLSSTLEAQRLEGN